MPIALRTSIAEPTLVVFGALRWELAPILAALTCVRPNRLAEFPSWVGRAGDRDVRVVKTGIGCERARRAALRACGEASVGECSWFVSTGCAGALRTDLDPGALVVATDVLNQGGRSVGRSMFEDAERLCGLARSHDLPVHAGRFYSVDEPLLTVADKREARRATGAIVVEMEGAAIAAVAAAHGIRFSAVRAILDAADMSVPDIPAATDADGGIGVFIAQVACRPRAVLGFGRLLAPRRAARLALDRFFRAFLHGEALAHLHGTRAASPDRS